MANESPASAEAGPSIENKAPQCRGRNHPVFKRRRKVVAFIPQKEFPVEDLLTEAEVESRISNLPGHVRDGIRFHQGRFIEPLKDLVATLEAVTIAARTRIDLAKRQVERIVTDVARVRRDGTTLEKENLRSLPGRVDLEFLERSEVRREDDEAIAELDRKIKDVKDGKRTEKDVKEGRATGDKESELYALEKERRELVERRSRVPFQTRDLIYRGPVNPLNESLIDPASEAWFRTLESAEIDLRDRTNSLLTKLGSLLLAHRAARGMAELVEPGALVALA